MAYKSNLAGAVLLALTSVIAAPACAATYTVFAAGNSSSGGTGLDSLILTAGQSFSVSVDPGDLWSSGPLPRWSNADGLTGDLFATGSDDSGQPAGTLIGQDFGLWTQDGLSAPYGTLVGRIDLGPYFIIGTSFTGVAPVSGVLRFYYWDENSGDNSESITAITADVTTTPLPAALPLFLGGLGAMAFLARRRRHRKV